MVASHDWYDTRQRKNSLYRCLSSLSYARFRPPKVQQKAMRKSLLGNFVWQIDEKIQNNINSDAIDVLSGLREDELVARKSLTSVDWAVFRCEYNIYKYRPHEYEPECSK